MDISMNLCQCECQGWIRDILLHEAYRSVLKNVEDTDKQIKRKKMTLNILTTFMYLPVCLPSSL